MATEMKKHFVVFCSPGTFVSETSELPIETWDVVEAKRLSRDIKERHGATPYGFYFTTRERKANELDSKQTKRSNMHYLGGRVMTLEDIKEEMPDERILISNMINNGIDRVIVNNNSYRSILPFQDGDVVV